MPKSPKSNAAKPAAAAAHAPAKAGAHNGAKAAASKPAAAVVPAAVTPEPAAATADQAAGAGPSIADYLLGNKKKSAATSHADAKLTPFLRKQKQRLLQLRDAMLDSMSGVAQDNLRSRTDGNEASAFGMHQADAGSDFYDRDFALSLLSQEQDALYEIDEALKRIDLGTYGVCEMSNKPINQERLEAIPFTRFTVECQAQIERQNKAQRVRHSVTSLFGLTDDDEPEKEEEEFTSENKE